MAEPGPARNWVTELAEHEAAGPEREIYDSLRALCGVPMVALIWRHLATLPGALPWAWELLRPALADGRIQRAAWSIADRVTVPVLSPVPAAALRAVGLDANACAGIRDVLRAYNRANPVNIVALSCVARHLAALQAEAPPIAAVAAPVGGGGPWHPPAPLPALPPMIAPDRMGREVRDLAALLSDRDRSQRAPILPSLWRHLASWPPMLAISVLLVPPRFEEIDAAAGRVLDAARDAAESIAGTLPVPPGGVARAAGFAIDARRAIDAFSPRIPEMVVIGTMLQHALPAGGADPRGVADA